MPGEGGAVAPLLRHDVDEAIAEGGAVHELDAHLRPQQRRLRIDEESRLEARKAWFSTGEGVQGARRRSAGRSGTGWQRGEVRRAAPLRPGKGTRAPAGRGARDDEGREGRAWRSSFAAFVARRVRGVRRAGDQSAWAARLGACLAVAAARAFFCASRFSIQCSTLRATGPAMKTEE